MNSKQKQLLASINIPNILTITRIMLTPFFVICLSKQLFDTALMTFSIAAATDGLDGFLARYFDQRTRLGAYLDPIADKLLLSASYVSLAFLKIIPTWLTVIVISRDILIVVGIAIFTMFRISYEIKPSLVSKCTTFAQFITILLVLLYTLMGWNNLMKDALYWITVSLTITSGLHYTYVGMNILQNSNFEGHE